MLFRVYDTKRKRWVKRNMCLTLDGELIILKRRFFGLYKLFNQSNNNRYIYHKAIDLWDVNGTQVYEGDYILAQVDENKTVVGLVVFAQEMSAYIILSKDSDEFFTLGNEVTEFIEVIGNVFDGYDEDKKDGGNEAL